MELSDKCGKELQVAVDAEVKRQTVKLKQRAAGLEKDRDKMRQERDDVRAAFVQEQVNAKNLNDHVGRLEQQLRESLASEKALKTALAFTGRLPTPRRSCRLLTTSWSGTLAGPTSTWSSNQRNPNSQPPR